MERQRLGGTAGDRFRRVGRLREDPWRRRRCDSQTDQSDSA
jgi:hypothetical protein